MLAMGYWIPVKAEVAQILLERAWFRARSGQADAKPWPWADTAPIARLSIPGFGVSWVVLSGASGRNLAFAPSHLDGSAPPGATGASVIAGHRDTHFAILEELQAGTEIVLEDSGGRIFHYEVVRTHIVDADRAHLRLDSESPSLLLVTCYPFDALTAGGSLRFVVEANSVPDSHGT
jgi:sortase A